MATITGSTIKAGRSTMRVAVTFHLTSDLKSVINTLRYSDVVEMVRTLDKVDLTFANGEKIHIDNVTATAMLGFGFKA